MEITSCPESFSRHLNPARFLNDLWAGRSILFHFAIREVSQRYRGARLGVVWIFLQPLFLLGVYTIAFGLVAKLKWPESHRAGLGEAAMAVYCGLTVFGVLSECASRAPTLLMENQSYVKRARFPFQMLPFCVVLSASFHALVNLAVLMVLGWLAEGFYAPALLAPFFLMPLIAFSCGIALLLAVLGPVFRDIRQCIPAILLAITFLTPIVYSPSLVPPRMKWLVVSNPLAFGITSIRHLVLWRGAGDWQWLGIWMGVCSAFVIGAYAIFMKFRYEVADSI